MSKTLDLAFKVGDVVRITRGAHADRIGRVTYSISTGTAHVEFAAPVLITQQDGPTEVVNLPYSFDELELLGGHVLVHPSSTSFVRTTPLPQDFRPKHCDGASTHPSSCLHLHPGDEACGCGQAVLPPDGGAIVLQLRPHNVGGSAPVPFVRHSRESCHEVSPATVGSRVSS